MYLSYPYIYRMVLSQNPDVFSAINDFTTERAFCLIPHKEYRAIRPGNIRDKMVFYPPVHIAEPAILQRSL